MSTEFTTDLVPYSPNVAGTSKPERGIDIVRMLRLRLPLMTGVFFAIAIPSLAAVWFLVPQEYTATDTLRFHAEDRPILYEMGGGDSTTQYERIMNSNVAKVQDRNFLARVASLPTVKDRLPIGNTDKLSFLQARLQARSIPRTELLEVSGTFGDPETAKAVVSAVIGRLFDEALRQPTQEKSNQRKVLGEQQEDLNKRVEEKIKQIQGLRRQASAPWMALGGGGPGDALRAIKGQAELELARAQADKEALKTQVGLLEKRKESPNFNNELDYGNLESLAKSDIAVSTLINRELSLREEVEGSNWGPDHPMLRHRQERLKKVQGDLAKALAKSRQSVLEAEIKKGQEAVKIAEARVVEVQGRVDGYTKQISDEQNQGNELIKSQQDAAIAEGELEQLKSRLKQVDDQIYKLDVEEDAPKRVEKPTVGDLMPVSNHGKRLKITLVVLVGAAGVAFGLGLVKELTDQQLRSSEDVTYITPLPVLAAIPHLTEDNLPADTNAATLAEDFPDTVSAEEFRRILARIVYPPEGAVEVKTILVTSPSRGDGKTSLVCNLAIALSQANRRVLIVDVAARRPGVEKCFGLEPDHGVAEVFAGEFVAEEVIRDTDYPNVVVMGPGLHGKEVTSKLASREAVEFFEGAEHAFDHVIIDTPPCLLTSDAKLLAPVMDGVIVVAGVGVSTTGMIRRCLLDMQQCGAQVLGIVLNGIRTTRGGDLRRNRDAYYAYGNENGSANGSNGHPAHTRAARRDHADDEALPSLILLSDEPDVEVEPPERS